jgi:hypothetical protein
MTNSPFADWTDEQIDKIDERFPSITQTDMWYKPGGEDQINFYIRAEEAKNFFMDPDILLAIRQLNMRLMQRGACIYGRYHCMDLADLLLDSGASA